MFYFSNFPTTLYQVAPASFSKAAEYVALTDITRNVRFKKEVIDNIVLYDFYDIKENETIELVSEKLYGSPYYHWVLMLLNNKFDYINDFPLDSIAFTDYLNQKYDADYLDSQYGVPLQGLVVDILSSNGQSIDIKGNIPITTGNTQSLVPAMSVWYYDSTLKKSIKRFRRTDVANTYIDTKVSTINYGAIPNVVTINAYDNENSLNENKRRIKVISEELLSVITRNFKDLM